MASHQGEGFVCSWQPGQLEGEQAAPPSVPGQGMQSCAALRCWQCLRPPPDAKLGRRPTRPPKVGGSWHLQPAQQAQKKEAPLMLVLLRKGCSRLSTSSPHTWLMTSGGRSFHLERSDPIQPGQPASGRRQHPAGHRRGEVGRARVAPMRVMELPEIHSPASPQPGNSARRPPGTERVSSPPPWRIFDDGRHSQSEPQQFRLSGLQTVIHVVRSSVHISFREERNPRIGQISKERKQLALHANLPDF